MSEETPSPRGLRVLVVGGRAFHDDAAVAAELNLLHAGLGEVGEVLADDTQAGDAAMRWAAQQGVSHRRATAADRAGLPRADTVAVAFPDGVVLELRRAGIEVCEVRVA